MKIYKITQESGGYDVYNGFVIVAKNEIQVLGIAKNNAADEGIEARKKENIKEIGDYTGEQVEAFILLSDFRAG